MEASAADPHFPIYISSDEDAFLANSYGAEEIQIQQAILLSLDSSRAPTTTHSSSSSSPAAPFSSSHPAGASTPQESAEESPPDRKGKRKLSSEEDGPSDSKKKRRKRNRFKCTICMEKVRVSEQFLVSYCDHAFCNSCVGRYVAAKVGENVAVVACPDPECEEGFVEIDLCRDIIPPELIDRWSIALCELALGDDKYYCPFKDCSALLINDNDGTVRIRETECPHCHRMFCAQCRVPWHEGIKCKEFRKLEGDEKGEDDLMFKKLADKKKWQRCPKCKMYVSRISGCLQIKCRCEQYFCYHCAAPMKKNRHYCGVIGFGAVVRPTRSGLTVI